MQSPNYVQEFIDSFCQNIRNCKQNIKYNSQKCILVDSFEHNSDVTQFNQEKLKQLIKNNQRHFQENEEEEEPNLFKKLKINCSFLDVLQPNEVKRIPYKLNLVSYHHLIIFQVIGLDETLVQVIEKNHFISKDFAKIIDTRRSQQLELIVEKERDIKEFEFSSEIGLKQQLCLIERPYIQEFLQELAKSYRLFIYSNSSKSYVNEIIALITKDFDIPINRIYTSPSKVSKKDISNIVEDQYNAANRTLIIDDDISLWSEQDQGNLVHCKRFLPLDCSLGEQKDKHFTFSVRNSMQSFLNNKYQSKFIDNEIFKVKNAYLDSLKDFLLKVANSYANQVKKENVNLLDIRSVKDSVMRTATKLQNQKVLVTVAFDAITQNIFKEILVKLGATIIEDLQQCNYVLLSREEANFLAENQEIPSNHLMKVQQVLLLKNINGQLIITDFELLELYFTFRDNQQ